MISVASAASVEDGSAAQEAGQVQQEPEHDQEHPGEYEPLSNDQARGAFASDEMEPITCTASERNP